MSCIWIPNATWSLGGARTVSRLIWNADTGQPLLELKGHTGNVLSVAFSPDSGPQERVVTISTDKTTRVWDARTGTTLLELKGHSGLVSNVSFTVDGSRILTACRASHGDPTLAKVIAWDVRDRPQEIELVGHKEWITLASLAMHYQRAGRAKEAVLLLEECFPTIEWVESSLLEAYEKEGEHAKIVNLVEQQLNAARKAFTADSAELAMKLDQCGFWLMKVSAFVQAEEVLRENPAIRSQKTEAEIGPSAEIQCRLGAALLSQQKFAEAEPVLVQGYEGLKKQFAGQDPRGLRLTSSRRAIA